MHAYERGRLDLPFVGHCTFGKRAPCLDWDALDADVAVLGVPYDMGTQYRAGRALRPARHPRGLDAVLLRPWRRLRPRGRRGLPGDGQGPDRRRGRRRHRPYRHRRQPRQHGGGGPQDPRARRDAGGPGRRSCDQHPLRAGVQRPGADPPRPDRRASRLRRRAARRARGPWQPDAARLGAGACHRADPARDPQRLLDGPRGLRGRAPAWLADPLGAAMPSARA